MITTAYVGADIDLKNGGLGPDLMSPTNTIWLTERQSFEPLKLVVSMLAHWSSHYLRSFIRKSLDHSVFSLFKSLRTMYLDNTIQPQRNQRIWLLCAVVIAFCAVL